MTESVMQEWLVSKTINELWISPGEQYLKFTTDVGDYYFKTDAECCSETWFADIIGVQNLLGATIINIEDIEDRYHVKDGRSRQDDDDIYGVKLTTDKGYCDIIFRNSSNGYYGGGLYYYGCVYDGEFVSPNNDEFDVRSLQTMKQLLDDFQA